MSGAQAKFEMSLGHEMEGKKTIKLNKANGG